MKYRTEFDSLGKIKVPGDKYWGASTQRSSKYFDIGDFLVRPIVIQSIDDCDAYINLRIQPSLPQVRSNQEDSRTVMYRNTT